MSRFQIGAMVDSFRLPIPEGVRKAREVGAHGIQVYATSGDMSAEALTPEKRVAFRQLVSDNGLVISALCGDLGGAGFMMSEENEEKIRRSEAIVDLAVDLGTKVVTTHIGHVPAEDSHPCYQNELKVCRILGAYAEAHGVAFAIETGPETSGRLRHFLDEVDSRGIGVNMDPANLVMVQNEDPVQAVHNLGKYIVHTHAKDGIHLKEFDPLLVYGTPGTTPVDPIRWGELFREVPLGEGGVPWDAYLDALAAEGFGGFLTIEREVGENPEADIRKAVSFLKAKI